MICPQCQHENPDVARFCRICGTPLQGGDAEELHESQPEPGLCLNCGHQNGPSAQYCASCGTRLHDTQGYRAPEHLTPAGERPPPMPQGGFTDIVGLSFSVYGYHFWPFFLIALIPQIPSLIGELLTLSSDNGLVEISIAMIVVSAVIGVLANGALVHGVSRHFLGRSVYIQQSLAYAWARFLPLLGTVLLVVFALIIPAALSFFLIGLPFLVFLVIIWLFGMQTVVIEQRTPVEALRRSWQIIRGSWWRVFLITLGLILMLIGLGILMGLVLLAAAEIAGMLATLLGALLSALITPILSIAFTILYFDLRARKEQFTHSDLVRELRE